MIIAKLQNLICWNSYILMFNLMFSLKYHDVKEQKIVDFTRWLRLHPLLDQSQKLTVETGFYLAVM